MEPTAAIALGRSENASVANRTGSRARLAMEDQQQSQTTTTTTLRGGAAKNGKGPGSLVSMCLNAVVTSLERYSPEAFQILGEEDFDEIVELRHRRTAPKEGSGGLDGTGRVAPSLSDKFLAEVERINPHLAESSVVDRLVWKDCVNFRFREGGLTRPSALALPWPLLVEKVASSASVLVVPPSRQEGSEGGGGPTAGAGLDLPGIDEALRILEMCPMNVPLLQATGVGKTVRKFIKAHRNQSNASSRTVEAVQRLERLLSSWMDMAEKDSASSVVAVAGMPAPTAVAKTGTVSSSVNEAERDLKIAQNCQSWRQLFHALKDRADSCRTVQGERMRKIRNNLARDRPKVVKVRPAPAKSSRLLSRIEEGKVVTPSTSATPAAAKMSKLWKETAVAAHRSRRPSVPNPPAPLKRAPAASLSSSSSASFGAAVAFAAASSSKKRPTSKGPGSQFKAPSKLITLSGGKLMRVPKHNPSAVAAGAAASRSSHPVSSRPTSSGTSSLSSSSATFRRGINR